MSDFLLVDGDLVFNGSGALALSTDGEQLATRITVALETLKGRWAYNTSLGVPWFSKVFVKGVTKDQVDAIIKAALVGVDGVVALTSYTSTVLEAQRRYSATFAARMTNGVTLSGELTQNEIQKRTSAGLWTVTIQRNGVRSCH